jgi:hypothetical protein
MDSATKARFAESNSAERVNSNLKDNYGGRNIRVKGAAKVMTHLMFGFIVITARSNPGRTKIAPLYASSLNIH